MESSVINTYVWIKATAISRRKRIARMGVNWFIIKIGLLHKAIRMWPAVILAARRTDRVMGRITCLTVSIKVINWERGRGVPKGTRWLKKCWVFLNILNKIILNHIGTANVKVNVIWDEMV